MAALIQILSLLPTWLLYIPIPSSQVASRTPPTWAVEGPPPRLNRGSGIFLYYFNNQELGSFG